MWVSNDLDNNIIISDKTIKHTGKKKWSVVKLIPALTTEICKIQLRASEDNWRRSWCRIGVISENFKSWTSVIDCSGIWMIGGKGDLYENEEYVGRFKGFGAGDLIGLNIDMQKKRLAFYKNEEYNCSLSKLSDVVYIAVAMGGSPISLTIENILIDNSNTIVNDHSTINNNIKKFLSFGNKKYLQSRERIYKEAQALNIFDKCCVEKDNVYDEPIYKEMIERVNCEWFQTSRGGGWWSWKPYIVHKHLKNLNNGDILFYCDAGTQIHNCYKTIDQFNYLFDLVSDSEKCPTGIIAFNTKGQLSTQVEYKWTIKALFYYFDVYDNKSITDTHQVEATVLCICKNKKNMEIIEKWWNTVLFHPELCIGDRRICPILRESWPPGKEGFKDHRHDQSIWSILCKLNNVIIFNHNRNPIYQSHLRF